MKSVFNLFPIVKMKTSLETVVAWAKRKGFVYPNSEIYGGLANAWDFGPYGALLKKNIADLWVKHFTQEREDMVFMDTAIIAHPTTWQASGHLASFADALIDDKKTGQRFRADKLIEDFIEKNIDRSPLDVWTNKEKAIEKEFHLFLNTHNSPYSLSVLSYDPIREVEQRVSDSQTKEQAASLKMKLDEYFGLH